MESDRGGNAVKTICHGQYTEDDGADCSSDGRSPAAAAASPPPTKTTKIMAGSVGEPDEWGGDDESSDYYESADEDMYCSIHSQIEDNPRKEYDQRRSVDSSQPAAAGGGMTRPQSSDDLRPAGTSPELQHPPPTSISIPGNAGGQAIMNGYGNKMKKAKTTSKTKLNEEDHESGKTSNTSSSNYLCASNLRRGYLQEDDDDDDESDDDDENSVDHNLLKENHTTAQTDNEGEKVAPEPHNDQFTSVGLRWYNPIRNFCGCIVNDDRFQILIVFLIVLNAVMMGLGTYDFVEDNPRISRAFELTDLAFLIIFTVECVLQIGYHGYQLFSDGWLTFDLFVVVMSWSLDSVQIFRAVRVFRAFRLVARLGVLKELVTAIVAVLPRIGSILLLFTLVLYIYSVLCTVLFGDRTYGPENKDFFGRLDYSLFTLFQFITLDDWGSICREVMVYYPWSHAIFLSFLMISAFILYSLVVAVVCDAVAVVEHPDIAIQKFEKRMKKEKKKTKKRVRKMEKHLDQLSQQQMDILMSVQQRLMHLGSFRKDAFDSHIEADGESDLQQ